MLKCCETIFACFEGILFIGIDKENNIQNKYPFSENDTKNEIKYDCSDSDSEDNSDMYILPFNGYKITRRNIAFC